MSIAVGASLSYGQRPDGFGQPILRFVEFGNGFEVIAAGAGQVLFRLNVLQHHSHPEFLALLRQSQPFLGGGQPAPRQVDLFGLRMHPGECFHHLPDHFIMRLLRSEAGRVQARFRRALARDIPNAPRPDAPTDADEIILLMPEVPGVAVSAATQSASENGSADPSGRDPGCGAVSRR